MSDSQVRIARVVLAYPGDTRTEAETVEGVIAEVNRSVGTDRGVRLEPVTWKTHTFPGLHPDGPQGLIDPLLHLEECELLLAIFWKRFGTPTRQALSGTEHEIRAAWHMWNSTGRPQVMVYFNQASYTPRSKDEALQWGQVLQFKEEFPQEGLWWDYEGLEQFKDLVRGHLTNYIRAQYPLENDTASAAGETSGGGESADYFAVQQSVIRQYTRTFIGRIDALDALDTFVRSHDRGYFLVRGGPGQGKTALACSFITWWASVHHLVNRSGGRADVRLAMRSLIAQIPAARVPNVESIDGLAKVLEESLPFTIKGGRPAVVVVDALDELPAAAADIPWLPAEALPPGVYFVVTARPGAHMKRLSERLFGIPHLIYDLGPLTLAEMHSMLSPLNTGITDSELERIADASQGNPLYLRAVADELKRNPRYPMNALPASIDGFFRNATAGLTAGKPVLGDVLALLSVARMPLSVRDLSALTGIGQRDVNEGGIQPVLSFLLDLGGRYTFYHARFHEFIARTLYEEELVKAHQRFVDWLERPENRAHSYRSNSLAFHLFHAGDGERLERLVNEAFLAGKVRRSGYAVLEDLELLTRSMLERGNAAVIERCMRLVECVWQAAGGDIVAEVSRLVQPYQPGPSAFRTKLIEVPAPAVQGLDTFAAMLPKAEVAADFVEFAMRDGRLFAAIGDAPAVGLRSAFVARFLGNVFKHFVANHDECPSPSDVLRHVDATVRGHDAFDRISMQCVAVDPAARIIVIANAGHPDPVQYVARRRKADVLRLHGDQLLGADVNEGGIERPQYEVDMEPGDVFVMVSDGLTEDHVLQGDAYRYRFAGLLQGRAQDGARATGEAVLDDWRAHPREEDMGDDASIVVIAARTGEPAGNQR
jgi:hypothetical protein